MATIFVIQKRIIRNAIMFNNYKKVIHGGESMAIHYYLQAEQFVAGISLRNAQFEEENNLALHVCKEEEAILKNRRTLTAALQCDVEQLVCANQTHSDHFYKVTAADAGRGATSLHDAIPNTDALYTFEKNIVLSSFTADCVPVILYSEKDGVIGVVHSGWQGTVKEITLKLLNHLKHNEGCDLSALQIIIGPALSQRKFEVDKDVYDKFVALGYAEPFMYYKEETSKYHIDNQLTVKQQCLLSGVPEENITIDSMCTFESEKGFSYRQDRETGRHLTFIMRK